MREEYRLPVQFSKEERAQYAAWGIKKNKVETPLIVAVICIDLTVTILTLLFLTESLGSLSELNWFLRAWGDKVSDVTYVLVILLSILAIKPLDLLLDWIFGKPKPPRVLVLEPQVNGMQYTLTQGKETLCRGLLPWAEWDMAVLPLTNQIWIEGQCLTIGPNTVQTIYPKEKQKPWMEHPDLKLSGNIHLEEIQRKMEGYLASLEEQEREAEWSRTHQG